jgi:hypothetical protein
VNSKADDFAEAREFQFVHDVIAVAIDRPRRDVKCRGNFLVALSSGAELQDFDFSQRATNWAARRLRRNLRCRPARTHSSAPSKIVSRLLKTADGDARYREPREIRCPRRPSGRSRERRSAALPGLALRKSAS